ncbi:MAG: hypothetical protein SO137_07865, partial [Gemmiger sp.]|uniref:hypothetical protein n=1 Tax=Gemmiger sp. TaxID=2049027 RepID=UPI002A7F46F2
SVLFNFQGPVVAPGLPDSSFIISGQVLFVKHFFDIFLNFFFREILFRLCCKSVNPMVFSAVQLRK